MPTEVAFAAVAVAVAAVAAMAMVMGTRAATVVATVLMVLGACWWSGSIGGIFTKKQVHNLGLTLQ